MTWVRLDDQHDIHRKVARLTDLAYRLWVSGMAWCHRQKTPGLIPTGDASLIVPGRKAKEIARAVEELTVAGLWHATDGGHVYHDWQSYQTTPGATASERGKAGAAKRWGHSSEPLATIAKPVSHDAKAIANDAPIPIPIPIGDPEITELRPVPVSGTAQLALTPEPGPKPEPKPRKAPTAPHPVLVDHYVAEFARFRGVKPPFGGREARAVKAILEALGGDIDRAKAVVSNGLGATWGNPQTILTIANDPAKWLSGPPSAPKNGTSKPGAVLEFEPKTIDQVLAEQAAAEKRHAARGAS